METNSSLTSIAKTLRIEATALEKKAQHLDESLLKVIELLLATKGKLILTGVGKSGLIGAKMAATFASTGTPSLFLHPTEALHGDLGVVQKGDVVLAISYSGESPELNALLPHFKRFGLPLIAMSRSRTSTLGRHSDIFIDIAIDQEACPLGIAPTTSTTLTLALGDAIAVALMEARGFSKEDFASFHPGGALGKALFVTIDSLMQRDHLPMVRANATIKEAIIVMSGGRLGTLFIVDESQTLLGIVTDGDIRRALLESTFDLEERVYTIANKTPKTVHNTHMLAIEALQFIETHKIQLLAVVNDQHQLLGALHLHTLIEAGITHASQ
ncbi:MAG: hypothetical protein KU37_03870 [Sulfuricurvum sp. PC08-66]|nr:MAG: hypothetical protein KU37_03870 [Sulfuricurvum sp. PC08-66]